MTMISAGAVDLKEIEHLNGCRHAADAFPPGIRFLNSVQETMLALNRSRSSVYEMIAAGELKALKDGARIVVTGESIVERTRNLPPANIKPAKAA